MLISNNKIPEESGMMEKAMLWSSVQLNSMLDTDASHIAEMVINGSTMSIVSMTKKLNELPETPSSQMQALAFAVQELALYLDTHRDDREALELYRRYQQLLEKVRAEYQKRFGPLNHGTPQTSESYQWLDDPWPWEYTTNKEA